MIFTFETIKHQKPYLTEAQVKSWVVVANCTYENRIGKNLSSVLSIAEATNTANRVINAKYKTETPATEGKLSNGVSWKKVTEDIYCMAEADFQDEHPDGLPRVILKILQGENKESNGISKNKNYYGKDAVESLVQQLQTRRKMMIDHKTLDKFGRSLRDLTAIVEEAWVGDDNSAMAKVRILINKEDTGWIYETMKDFPEEVGVSINAMVRGQRGKMHGEDVFITTEIAFLISSDFVGDPSAGGGFVALAESHIQNKAPDSSKAAEYVSLMEARISNTEGPMNLLEFATTFEGELTDKLDTVGRKSQFWSMGNILSEVLYTVARSEDMDDDEKKKKIGEALTELATEVDRINPIALFPAGAMWYESIDYAKTLLSTCQEASRFYSAIESKNLVLEGELLSFKDVSTELFPDIEDGITQLENLETWSDVDKTLEGTEFLVEGFFPYAKSGNVNETARVALLQVFSESELKLPKNTWEKLVGKPSEAIESTNVPVTKEAIPVNPDEIKALSREQLLGAGNPIVQGLVDASVEEASRFTELQTALETVKSENMELAGKNDVLELKESERNRKISIDTLLAESKVLKSGNKTHISDTFYSQLLATESTDDAKILIADRETVISDLRATATGRIEGNAPTAGETGGTPVVEPLVEAYSLPVPPVTPHRIPQAIVEGDTSIIDLAARLKVGGTALVG